MANSIQGSALGTLVITGTEGDDNLIGGSGSEYIQGLGGNDYLDGNSTLTPQEGGDTLVGGTGNDRYRVHSTQDIVIEYADEGEDTVDSLVSYVLGEHLEHLILSDNDSGPADLNGTGNALNNTIVGNRGNNILDGGAGNDTLFGWEGSDTLIGGLGDDTFYIDDASDQVIESAGEGHDLVVAGISYTLGDNLEDLALGEGDINGTGNALNNQIYGGGGNNILDGGIGDDVLMGLLGDDTYLVDSDGDSVMEEADEGNDTVRSSVSHALTANIENLILIGDADINGSGNEFDNIITGNNGSNTLTSGEGIDTLIGGLGNDIYVIDRATDILVEAANEGIDTVKSSVTYTLAAHFENLGLDGSAHIDGTGNAADNTLSGNDGNNTLTGLDGDDVLDGGGGTDTLFGGGGNDTAVYAGAMSGYQLSLNANGRLVVTDINAVDGDTGVDTLNGIEQLQFSDGALTTPLGPWGEIHLNSQPTGDTGDPGLAVLADGSFVIVWDHNVGDDLGIYGVRYTAEGSKVGGEFQINIYNADVQWAPRIAALDGGGFAVTWMSENQDGFGFGVCAQVYGTDGSKVGNEVRVNTFTTMQQAHPSITALADGGFVVAWESNTQDGSEWGVYAQRFGADGTKLGGEFRINATTANSQMDSAITSLADGGFVVTWESSGQDGSLNGIYAQRYDASGLKVGGEVRVNTFTTGSQMDACITALSNGGYAVAWESDAQDGSLSGIYSQRYNAAGLKVGGEVQVNTTTAGRQMSADIAGLADGGYVITWITENQHGYAQRYDASGLKVGAEIRFNPEATGGRFSKVAATPDGGFIIAWDAQEGGNSGVYALRYDANGKVAAINGDAGNNTLNFSGAQAALAGGGGNDTYVVDNSGITLIELAGAGMDTVHSAVTWTLSANLENLVLTGNANINGTGNTANNVITGNSGNNTLNGAGGSDSLLGGAGNDTYVINASTITLTESTSAGTDLVQSSVTYTLGANIENLTLTGSTAINGTGNSIANVLTGNSADNVLRGEAGNDTLSGGSGNDHLIGGIGHDTLTGGAGIDRFRFDKDLNASTNLDTITSFVVADDTIQLENAVFKKLAVVGALQATNFKASLTGGAADADDFILYETDTGKLFYDVDGSGAVARVQFALVGSSTHPTLTAADFQVI